MRLVYFGLPLGALLLSRDGHPPVLSVLSPGAAPGRRRLRRIASGPVLEAAELETAPGTALLSALEREPPELLVSWFWTRRLTSRWLALPRLAAFGVHPSLLPRHRGPDPFFWAIDGGDVETGVSAHLLEAEYDTGPVLGMERLPIGDRNSWQLARALDRPSLRLLRALVGRYAAGSAPSPVPQAEAEVTLAPEPTGDALRVDFTWPSARVLRRIRALSPVPGLALEIDGVRFRVLSARVAERYVSALAPGEAELDPSRGVVLRTGDGAIVVERATLGDSDADDAETPISGRELARRVSERRSQPDPAEIARAPESR